MVNPIKTEAAVILCDNCGKRIAVKGIKVQEKERGEYHVSFFCCPHCGFAYQIYTTDQKQKELIAERREILSKVVTAATKNFRKKVIDGYRRQLAKKEEEIKLREAELRAIGDEIIKTEGV